MCQVISSAVLCPDGINVQPRYNFWNEKIMLNLDCVAATTLSVRARVCGVSQQWVCVCLSVSVSVGVHVCMWPCARVAAGCGYACDPCYLCIYVCDGK